MRKINSTIILLAPVVKISFLRVSIIKVLQFLPSNKGQMNMTLCRGILHAEDK